ncbi:cyclopropane-fatty-acyl-phospholipid synthase family protein [Nocardia sp. BMG51109]|uniref:SAM-dependent methyltransferase n=1 Tax=Nocardia sp. BMG51109 TaxID=1056816 RepID=UPI000466BABC|nr:class I SAM-dependent methyltransferase [Nocardia sp. BMG51109]
MTRQISSPEAVSATNRHYDLPPEVFEAFLDARMKYTCGLYRTGGESLDEAQRDKLAYIARLLHVGAGQRVLDIGCGWGSLAVYLAVEHGCRVTAVTPSRVQSEYVRDRAAGAGVTGLVTVETASIYDIDLSGRRFDAVALVGAIEHMPDHRTVLTTVAHRLRRGGRMYLSASCYRDESTFARYADHPGSRHVTDKIFGYGVLRPLSRLVAAAEDAGLSVSTVLDLTAHYRRTIEDWSARAAAHRDRIDAAVPGLADDLLRYFTITNSGWGYTTKQYALTAIRSREGETELVR